MAKTKTTKTVSKICPNCGGLLYESPKLTTERRCYCAPNILGWPDQSQTNPCPQCAEKDKIITQKEETIKRLEEENVLLNKYKESIIKAFESGELIRH